MSRLSQSFALTVLISLGPLGCQGSLQSPTGPGGYDGAGNPITPDVEPVCTPGAAPVGMAAPMRALTSVQYTNSVLDLFEGQVTPSTLYPKASGSGGTGFDTDLQLNVMSAGFAEGVSNAADEAALQVIGKLEQLLPCASGGLSTDCAAQFVDKYAAKAFRRPLAAAERSALLDQYNSAIGEHGSFPAAIAELASTILQHPEFIYRPEIGKLEDGQRLLDDYEMGSRLSYLFWNAPPDAELQRAAKAGELSKVEGVKAQAARMMKDPKFEGMLKHFTAQWVKSDGIAVGSKDPALFPELNQALADAMTEELDRFVIDAVRKGPGGFDALVSGRETFVNAPLAKLYGADAPGATDKDWVKVTLPAERSGVFTRAAVLAGFAGPAEGSHVRRGAFIFKGMLCAALGSPPANAQSSQPAYPAHATTRERSAILQKTMPCGSCHSQIDPIGLGLDNFDALGKTMAGTIDTTGHVFIDGATQDFNGAHELGGLLAQSEQAQECIARQWFRYTFGRTELRADACTYSGLSDDLVNTGGDLASMFAAVAVSDGFRYRATTGD